MFTITRAVYLLITTFALASDSLVPLPAAAQEAGRKSVIVAIPDSFPEVREPRGYTTNVRALVVQFASPSAKDMIILKESDASPQTLAAAMNLLRRFRGEVSDRRGDRVTTMVGFAPVRLRPDTEEALTARIRELRAGEPGRVGNLGRGRWVEIPAGSAAW